MVLRTSCLLLIPSYRAQFATEQQRFSLENHVRTVWPLQTRQIHVRQRGPVRHVTREQTLS